MNTLHNVHAWSQSELDAVQLAPNERIGYISPAWLTVMVDHGDGTYHNRLIMRNVIRDSVTTPEKENRRRKVAKSASDNKLDKEWWT